MHFSFAPPDVSLLQRCLRIRCARITHRMPACLPLHCQGPSPGKTAEPSFPEMVPLLTGHWRCSAQAQRGKAKGVDPLSDTLRQYMPYAEEV